jgi:hypothetical protein
MTSEQRTEIVLADVVAPEGQQVRTTSMPTPAGQVVIPVEVTGASSGGASSASSRSTIAPASQPPSARHRRLRPRPHCSVHSGRRQRKSVTRSIIEISKTRLTHRS